MSGQHRANYLEAMGITVWKERNVTRLTEHIPEAVANEETAHLLVSVSSRSDSPWLWVLADETPLQQALFRDIRRAVGDAGDSNICFAKNDGEAILSDLLDELLVTRIVLFGQELDADHSLREKSCDIVNAPSLEALAGSSELKKDLWVNLQQLLDFQRR